MSLICRSHRRAGAALLVLATLGLTSPVLVTPALAGPRKPAEQAYPGVIDLRVDASDVARGVFRVTERVPVLPGPLTLAYPKWLPGDHAPSGEIDKLVGLTIQAGGKPLAWRRDPLDVFAFQVEVPAGVDHLDLAFQYLPATSDQQGRTAATAQILNLQWNAVLLYPAGYGAGGVQVRASAIYPKGWTAATALTRVGERADDAEGVTTYQAAPLDVLIDSPVLAGRNGRAEPLGWGVSLDLFADRPGQTAIAPEQLAQHRALVDQAQKLFGGRHFDHYDFLVSVSDHIGRIGLEHHRSSENGVAGDYLTDWDSSLPDHDLLAHEFVHSWNGKYRRPADLWTPDYAAPMQGSLLWVYEGQTEFWGEVLAARAGLVSQQDALDALAMEAAAAQDPGRAWRALGDTTMDPLIFAGRSPMSTSWQRPAAYYGEGQLIWLDVDTLLRARSGGKVSLDDFAKSFFGARDGEAGELTYRFEDVVTALNALVPYDWATFLGARVDQAGRAAPLDGLARGGYRLVFTDQPSRFWQKREAQRHRLDLRYGAGLVLTRTGAVGEVTWGGPAFEAGLTVGSLIVAVNGQAYSDTGLKAAIVAAKDAKTPIVLLVKRDDDYRTVTLAWTGGLRYPRLEPIGKGPRSIDALYRPRP